MPSRVLEMCGGPRRLAPNENGIQIFKYGTRVYNNKDSR